MQTIIYNCLPNKICTNISQGNLLLVLTNVCVHANYSLQLVLHRIKNYYQSTNVARGSKYLLRIN